MLSLARLTLRTVLLGPIALLVVTACAQEESADLEWTPRIVEIYPHDAAAFTQGLTVHEGRLYEGTGQYGRSSVRLVDLETGRVERSVALERAYFGEGIAILGDRLFQLTWQNGVGFVYDVETFERIGTFDYEGEGWGLTHDGSHLIMSDGSATLRFLDPDDFSVTATLQVTDNGLPVTRLNELEYIDGEIWANVWYDDRIARISPESGEVLAWADLSGLYPQNLRLADDVLNGIAWDPVAERLFVTGKNWPQIFELQPP